MRFHRTATLLLATVVLALVAGCERVPPDSVAVVNDKPLKRYAFDAYIARLGNQGPIDQAQRAQLLDQAIDMQVLSLEALHQRLDYDPGVAGDVEVFRMRRLASALIKQHLTQHPITEEMLRAEYAKQSAGYRQTEYSARHVLVPSESEAIDVIRQIDRARPADRSKRFDALARTRSMDPGSAPKGGALGWFAADGMVKPFSDAVTALAKGEYTKHPVQTQFGWHVIIKDDEREATPPAYETMRENLQGALQERMVTGYINELRGSARILKRGEPTAATPPTVAK